MEQVSLRLWNIRVSPRFAQGPEPGYGALGWDPGGRTIVD
jgi:hypothetical protein